MQIWLADNFWENQFWKTKNEAKWRTFCERTSCTCIKERDMQSWFFFKEKYCYVHLNEWWVFQHSKCIRLNFINQNKKTKIRSTVVKIKSRDKLCAYVLFFLVLFGCNTYLSVHRPKNSKITLLIRSHSRFQIDFTLCTWNAKRPDKINFYSA